MEVHGGNTITISEAVLSNGDCAAYSNKYLLHLQSKVARHYESPKLESLRVGEPSHCSCS